jgi:hypothetical protein
MCHILIPIAINHLHSLTQFHHMHGSASGKNKECKLFNAINKSIYLEIPLTLTITGGDFRHIYNYEMAVRIHYTINVLFSCI